MKTFYLTVITVLCILIFANVTQAQQSVTGSGGNATGAGGSVCYTVGQVVYTTNVNTSGMVAQGVQQAYEIFVMTGIDEIYNIALEISVYPNPAFGFLKLKVVRYKPDNLIYQLYNINGSMLKNAKIVNNETVIPTGDLLPASYLLRISDNQKEVKTFKIIKN